MKRINEAIAEQAGRFTRGQQLLAHFISEHCDKAAFMSSFDLAAVTGVSQSTVIRFASALGYGGYGAFQEALQLELLSRSLSFYFIVILCGTLTLISYLLRKRREKT